MRRLPKSMVAEYHFLEKSDWCDCWKTVSDCFRLLLIYLVGVRSQGLETKFV